MSKACFSGSSSDAFPSAALIPPSAAPEWLRVGWSFETMRDVGAGVVGLDRGAHAGAAGADDEHVVLRVHRFGRYRIGARPARQAAAASARPPAAMSSSASNFSKLSRNISASSRAFASYASGSRQVERGSSSVDVDARHRRPAPRSRRARRSGTRRRRARRESAARSSARVACDRHPLALAERAARPAGVHEPDRRRRARRASRRAAARRPTGGCGRNGAPKQAEKVGCGSVTPISVPASFAVKPERK